MRQLPLVGPARLALVLFCFASLWLGTPSTAAAICGDSVIDCAENCDDGNATAGDGCNSSCRIEFGFNCPTTVDPASLSPIHRWTLNEVSGATATDSIRTLHGSYSGATLGATGAVPNKTGSAVSFDGVDDHVLLPHDVDLELAAGTVSFWFRADTLPAGPPASGLFSKDHNNLDDDGSHLSVFIEEGTHRLTFRLQKPLNGLQNDSTPCTLPAQCAGGACVFNATAGEDLCRGGSQYARTAGAVVVNSWYHVAASWGPSGMVLYVNGAQVAVNPYVGSLVGNTQPFVFGASTIGAVAGSSAPVEDFFDGRMDDIYVFDAQLTPAEVSSLYGGSSCSAPGGVCTAGAPAGCGDAIFDPFREECEDGNLAPNDGCNELCIIEHCGDGLVNKAGEVCDDGNRESGDGCDYNCLVETEYTCMGTPSVCSPTFTCGNMIVEAGEVCDNAATCSADCKRVLTCGDGILNGTEACDDYNTVGGDGCSATCTIESGWACTNPTATSYWFSPTYPSICSTVCGDGITAGLETCDDTNTTSGDGCDARCRAESCGDGFLRGAEACDDGNAAGGDGCSATCTKEVGFVCPPGPGPCVPETACDPAAFYFRTNFTGSYGSWRCPFDATYDGNADGSPDCRTGKTVAKYQNMPAFDVIAGDTRLSLDALSVSTTAVIGTIELAPALSNGSLEPGGPWVTVVANSPASSNGNTTANDYDLTWTATSNFSFAGGGLLMRITETSGTLGINVYYNDPKASYVYVDYDGVYPWDQYIVSWGLGLKVETGTPVCGPLKYGTCQDLGAGPVCVPVPRNYPNTTAWCGDSGQNCEPSEQWSYGTSSRTEPDGGRCGTIRLYHYDYECVVNAGIGSCSSVSGPSFPYLDRFCEHCDDSDPCTSTGFSSSSGCTFSATGNTTCWDGEASKRNIGSCSDGIDYCSNPGPECIGASYGSTDVCDGLDNDCNATIDDPSTADPTCDDADPLTSDTCSAGACSNIQLCAGTDVSCGASVPCSDCTALSGWTATGVSGPCCDGLNSCTCDEYELRTYYCSGTACDYILEPVSPTYTIVGGSCATCDDANICTTDSCNAGTGVCENPDTGYSGACYYGPAGTEGIGICSGGTEMCMAGTLGACSDVQPSVEACNNFDDDCNNIVDDGAADLSCPAGQDCWSGQCDDECLADGDCLATEYCYFENGLLPGRCALQPDPCLDVTCPPGRFCFAGSCTNTNCGSDLDCSIYSKCYNSGRCLNGDDDRCKGVQCPQGQQCTKGTCKPPCNVNADCASGNRCFDNFCFPDPDPCAGVDCAINEICYQNECFDQCAVDADCTTPGDVCYDAERCGPAADPCFNVVCAVGDICIEGGCFPVCGTTPDCTDPVNLCYDAARCAVDNCAGIQCPTNEACLGGACYLTCTTDIDCASIGPSHQCWGGFCLTGPCDNVQCATDQVCSGGVCYYTCLTDGDCSMYDPGHACYNGFCTDDPCAGVLCLSDQVCAGGSCYDICMASPDCDMSVPICWDDVRCSTDDPCLGIACATSDICYQGACYENCSGTLMCTDPTDVCYDNTRCAPGPCTDVQCPSEEFCYGGSCYQACGVDADCLDPSHACYDGRCALDACDGVQCGVAEVCYEGTCYETCNGSIDCSDPAAVCYNNLCVDPCDTVTCGAAETCYLGTCYEYCATDADCSDPTSICYDNRCVDAEDPWCDGVVCPGGEDCYRGTCYETCSTQADCSDPNSICYNNTCLPTDCGSTRCESNEICYNGVCYEDCSDGTCDDPADICYDNMRCAGSACEAQAQTFIDAYDSSHLFHKGKKRLHGVQLSLLPVVWPRAYRAPTPTSFDNWASVANGTGVSSNNDALYARGSARVVIFNDETDGDTYKLFLVHGSKNAAQGRAEATYSVVVRGVDPTVLMTDDRDGEGFKISPPLSGRTHIQAHVTTGATETGGVAIGKFPVDGNWEIQISANFSGDIQRWELMNGENGRVMAELSPAETFVLDTKTFADSKELQPEFGTVCETDKLGICKRGTVTACVNYQLTCDQTVYPWNFEICDRVDNTCDGFTDADDSSLQFAIVESLQAPAGWRPWPTVDDPGPVGRWLNYTPLSAADDRVGSTAPLRVDGTPVQDPSKVMMAMHRNLRTGAFSMPIMVGSPTSDASLLSTLAIASRAGWGVTGVGGTEIREAPVCWYDDRAPGPTSDEVLSSWDPGLQTMTWVSDLSTTSGTLESDTVALRPQWLQGVHGRPTHLSVRRDILDTVQRRWRRYAPSSTDLALNPSLSLEVRLSAKDPTEAYCITDTPSAAGCSVGTYMCTATGIVCGPGVDDNCVAGCADNDADGHISFDPIFCTMGTDCDDYDPNAYYGAMEQCNGRDNDCDGLIDTQTIGPCADGSALCGPSDCNGQQVCTCPAGVVEFYGDPADTCQCGEGLAP